jgi:hypothetical protein
MERVFILDRSGSMASCWDDTIGGFNAFLEDQKQYGGTLSLNQFDHEFTVCYKDEPIEKVEPLTRATFVPRGSTALLDAIGSAIKMCEGKEMPVFAILTDGLENASHTYTKAHIKDLIEQKTKDGWTFIYLGANQDAFAEAGSLGISARTTMNYEGSRTPEAFASLSATMTQCNGI